MPGRRPTRANGLTREERDERNAKVVRLYNRGHSMWDIGRRFGISGVAVSKILRGVREKWQSLQVTEYGEYVLHQRDKFGEVVKNAWRSYVRSLKDHEKLEYGMVGGEEDEAPSFELVKRMVEGQAGNAAFLTVILKAMRDEAELLGFVKNTVINNQNTNTNVNQNEGLSPVLSAPPDAIEERIAAQTEMPALPERGEA